MKLQQILNFQIDHCSFPIMFLWRLFPSTLTILSHNAFSPWRVSFVPIVNKACKSKFVFTDWENTLESTHQYKKNVPVKI